MSNFTIVAIAMPQVAEALDRSGQFASVEAVGSTGGLRDLIRGGTLTPGVDDKVFLFSDATPVDTPQGLAYLVQQMASKARVIVVATTPAGEELVQAVPSAGLIKGSLRVNTVVGAIGGMGVQVRPVSEEENLALDPSLQAGPLPAPAPSAPASDPFAQRPAAPAATPANPFAAPTATSNPFAAPAAHPSPAADPAPAPAATDPGPSAAPSASPAASPAASPEASSNPFAAASGAAAPQAAPQPQPVQSDSSAPANAFGAGQSDSANPFGGAGPSQEPTSNPFGGASAPAAGSPFQSAAAYADGHTAQPETHPSSAGTANPFAPSSPSSPDPQPSEQPGQPSGAGVANPFAGQQAGGQTPFADSPRPPVTTQPVDSPFAQQTQQPGQQPVAAGVNPFGNPVASSPMPTGQPGSPFAAGGAPVARVGAPEADRPPRRGYVITITSPKGGTGKSSMSLNLATYLGLRTQGQRTVALIDANVQQADAGKYLGAWQPNIEDLGKDASAIHPDRINNHLLHKRELNLSVLLGPMSPDVAHPVYYNGKKYAQILEAMRPNFDYIIVDTPVAEYYHDMFREFALPCADFVLVTLAPNYTTLMNTDAWLRQVCAPRQSGGMGLDPNQVGVVLNRAEEEIGFSELEVQRDLNEWRYLGAIPETKEWKKANNESKLVATMNYAELNEAFSNILFQATGDDLLRSGPSNLGNSGGGLGDKLKEMFSGLGKKDKSKKKGA